MKFGKQIQADQVPGWSAFYLDYKGLKKIISLLVSQRHADIAPAAPSNVPLHVTTTTAAPYPASALPSPRTLLREGPASLPVLAALGGQDEDRGPNFQAHKAAFFFKLDRELEKINAFYLQKEAELKLRLETLLAKRRAAALRVLPSEDDESMQNHVEWSAVEEGFRLLERDLRKLQQYVEINATGFRKILKKWDKRSRSATKELYLARQVEVQPVFNRQLISELSDAVATCLLDVTDLSNGLNVEKPAVNDLILSNQILAERSSQPGAFQDLENNLRTAVANGDEATIRDLVRYSDVLASQPGRAINVTRILWKAIIDAPKEIADLILSCPANPFDFHFIDDINGRTTLHSAAMVGMLRLVNICLEKGVEAAKCDAYGRSALHYACMNGHPDVCRRLLEVGLPPDQVDMDNYSPLTYATLRGSTECVRALLEQGNISLGQESLSTDSMPLALSSQAGHVDVVNLLLDHGARSLPNTNGEYPIHLAAKEGHSEVCKILIGFEGWDVADKYNEWTPLFHAARYGHTRCVEVLLDAGARVDALDEVGNSPVYYAAWYGHRDCAGLLLHAMALLPRRTSLSPPRKSPPSDNVKPFESDIDMIPSLSLPPPIMPYRIYGHNFLDKTFLVQIALGQNMWDRPSEPHSPIKLHPRLTGAQNRDLTLHASPFLKLVITARGDATTAPFTIYLPMKDEAHVFSFQTSSLDKLTLEFSIYPNFGTKTIGRATALPALFPAAKQDAPYVLPILDHRLHVLGEVTFGINVVSPFRSATLGIGGAVETYWKSMAMPISTPIRDTPRSGPAIASAATSPSNRSVAAIGGHAITISSVTGSYLYLVVQVTADHQPVIYPQWRLPEDRYSLGVADVSLEQFERLAHQLGQTLDRPEAVRPTTRDWRDYLDRSMVSLRRLLQVLPATLGVALELASPSQSHMDHFSIRNKLNLNDFVDSVLRVVYETPTHVDGAGSAVRRRVVFSSFSPDVCAALNWKQPNYPVFFASQCGKTLQTPPSCAATGAPDLSDRRLFGLGAAVGFAKNNNLLGVLLEAETLVQVPSLVQGVKDAGLLVGAFGKEQEVSPLTPAGVDVPTVDAILQRGVLSVEHSMRGLLY